MTVIYKKMTQTQMIVVGYLLLILLGSILLMLPVSSRDGNMTSFADALFTATTSVCVTGLVTVTTASHWSTIGKAAILLLIQIGGIGVVSLASMLFIGLHKKISLRNRRLI